MVQHACTLDVCLDVAQRSVIVNVNVNVNNLLASDWLPLKPHVQPYVQPSS